MSRLLFCLGPLLMAVMAGSAVAAENTIAIAGVGSSLGTMKRLAAAYEKKHPEVMVRVLPGLGSGGSVKALAAGAVDIAVTGRPLNEEEAKPGFSVMEVARSPFVFVVSPQNPRADITTSELEQIFSGDITLCEDGAQIRLILRPESDSDSSIVRSISPAVAAAYGKAHSRKGMIVALTDQENASFLRAKGGVFGFCTLTQLVTEQLSLKVLAFNGVVPSLRSLGDGSYKLYKPMFLVTAPAPRRAVDDFIRFVLSSEGRTIVRMSGNLFIYPAARNK